MPWKKGDRPINVFAGGSEGAGWAIKPSWDADTYHHTINWDCLYAGRAVPALAPELIGAARATLR